MIRLIRVAAVAATAVFLLAGACGDGKSEQSSGVTDPNSSAPQKTTTTTKQLEGPQAYVDSGNYVTGLHVGYIHAVSKTDRKIEFDVAQFLTGDEAKKAFQEDTKSSEPPDDDYWVRNQNTQLRDFVLSDNAMFRVNNLGGFDPSAPDEGHVVDFDTFISYFDKNPEQAQHTLFWISLEDGPIAHVEEQFVP